MNAWNYIFVPCMSSKRQQAKYLLFCSYVFKHHLCEKLRHIHKIDWLIKLKWKTLAPTNISLQLSCEVSLHSFTSICHRISRQVNIFNCRHDFIFVLKIHKQSIGSFHKRFLDHFSIWKWFFILGKNMENSMWCCISCLMSCIWPGENRLVYG